MADVTQKLADGVRDVKGAVVDLHAWITQQVDNVDLIAREASYAWGAVAAQVEYQDVSVVREEEHIETHKPASVLRRCEADRRILARHKIDPSRVEDFTHATACEGCGEWGEFSYPVSENINDCPELLDLAYAYGITPEILAALHRPQPPEVKPTPPSPFGRLLAEAYGPALLNGLHTSLAYGRTHIPPVELPGEHPEEP